MNCKECKQELHLNAVQMGGYHLGCAEEEVIVFKIRPEPGMGWLVGEGFDWIKHTLEQMSPDDCDTLEIECVRMPRITVDNLPEHVGW
jgi:hypothetical protein